MFLAPKTKHSWQRFADYSAANLYLGRSQLPHPKKESLWEGGVTDLIEADNEDTADILSVSFCRQWAKLFAHTSSSHSGLEKPRLRHSFWRVKTFRGSLFSSSEERRDFSPERKCPEAVRDLVVRFLRCRAISSLFLRHLRLKIRRGGGCHRDIKKRGFRDSVTSGENREDKNIRCF